MYWTMLSVRYIYSRSQLIYFSAIPDSKDHGANMGPMVGRQHPGEPHIGPMVFAIWDVNQLVLVIYTKAAIQLAGKNLKVDVSLWDTL